MLRNVSQERTFATKKHPELLTIKARYGYGWLSPSMELPSAQPNLGETFWVKSMIATLPPPHYVRPIFAKFSNHIGHLVLHYHHAAGVADGTLQEGSLSCHRTSAELRRPHGTPMFVEWGSYGGFLK